MTVDGGTGVMQLQAKEWQPMPAITTSSKEARKDAPLHVSEDTALPCFWTSSLQKCETINFCCFKPPGLWYFVTATLGK